MNSHNESVRFFVRRKRSALQVLAGGLFLLVLLGGGWGRAEQSASRGALFAAAFFPKQANALSFENASSEDVFEAHVLLNLLGYGSVPLKTEVDLKFKSILALFSEGEGTVGEEQEGLGRVLQRLREEREEKFTQKEYEFLYLCMTGRPDQIKKTARYRLYPRWKDSNGKSLLMYAAGHNPNPEVIRLFLNAGADVNARSENSFWGGTLGVTPLLCAAATNENPEVITTLLEAGADIDARAEGNNLLFIIGKFAGASVLISAAESNGNPEVIRTLLDAGAEMGENSADGEIECFFSAPMCAAAFNPNPEILKVFLEAGADVNARGVNHPSTPLELAVMFNENPEVAATLLNAGACVHIAPYGNETDEYKLDGKSIEISMYGDDDGMTVLMYAARQNRNPEVIRVLLNAGARIHARDVDGKTALMYAAEHNQTEVVRTLLDAGARVDVKDNLDRTALMYAEGQHNPNSEIIALLSGAE